MKGVDSEVIACLHNPCHHPTQLWVPWDCLLYYTVNEDFLVAYNDEVFVSSVNS